MRNLTTRGALAVLAIAAMTMTACGAADDAGMDATADEAEASSAPQDLMDAGEATAQDGAGRAGDAGASLSDHDAATSDIAEPESIAPPEPEPGPEEGGIETVLFDDHGVSGWVDAATQPVSTFQTDADVASFRLAESWLTSGILPPPEAIRAEEWINVLEHDHPAPSGGDVWRVTADAGDPWWQTGPDAPASTRLVRVGLRAADPVERPPASITFVVDVSGSMSHDNRLDAVVDVIGRFTSTLDADDQVGVVTFADEASVLIEHTNQFGAVRDALASLEPTTSTNTGAGVLLGHERAAAAHRPGDNSAVVVVADGLANRGITDPEAILEQLDRIEAPTRIVTHTVGLGREVFSDALLERLANASGGTYAYADGPQHTDRLFTHGLPLLQPVAHDVKAQVEFDPAAVRSWRLIGYENRLIAAEDFRNDDVVGAYVGAGHAVTALYELDLQVEGGDPSSSLGTVTVRWADPGSREVSELAEVLRTDLATVDSTSTTWASAAGMASLVEVLRGSPHSLVNLEQTAERLAQAGSSQDAWLAGLVREAAAATQGAAPARQETPLP